MIFRSLGGGDANFNSAFYTKGNPSFDAASAIAVPLPGSAPAYNYQLLVVNSTFMILYGATTHTSSTSDVKGNTYTIEPGVDTTFAARSPNANAGKNCCSLDVDSVM